MVETTNHVVEVWDIPSQRRIGVLKTAIAPAVEHSFVASPDTRFLYEMQPTWSIRRLWDLRSGDLVKAFDDNSSWGMAFSPDGRLLARGFGKGNAELWDIAAGRMRYRLTGHRSAVLAFSFSSDGRLLAIGSYGKDIHVWDLRSGQAPQRHPARNSSEEAGRWS